MPRAVRWLLVFAFLHGSWYALIVLPWQAPDEFLHYEYMRLIDAQGSLDLHSSDRSAAIQWPIAQSLLVFEHFRYRELPTPPEDWYLETPTPLGSANFLPQPPLFYLASLPIYWALAAQPLLVQLFALRLFSVLLLCLTVWLTYRLAGLIFDIEDHPWLALFPAACIAILPQYTFISASYNNDNLAPPMVAAALIFLVRGYQHEAKLRDVALATFFGLMALASKRTAIAMIPVLGIALLTYGAKWSRAGRAWKKLVGGGVYAAAAAVMAGLLAVYLHPPILPVNIARQLRLSPTALIHLKNAFAPGALSGQVDWSWFFGILVESFWGRFGWMTVRVPPLLRTLSVLVTAIVIVGFFIAALQRVKHGDDLLQCGAFCVELLGAGIGFTFIAVAAQYLVAPTIYTPQGRYLFPFLPAIAILATWGWLALWPHRLRPAAMIIAWLALAAYDVYTWAFVLVPTWYS